MKVLNLPGPIAKSYIERDNAVISPSYPRGYPFVMDHGSGVEVWDVDGNRFLDFAQVEFILQVLLQGVTDGALGVSAANVQGYLVHAFDLVRDL